MDVENGVATATLPPEVRLGVERMLPVDRIRPRTDQPRDYFNPSKMRKLRRGIETAGQVTAIEVRPINDDPDHDHEIVEGDRRHRVFTEKGWPEIRAVIREEDDDDAAWIKSLVANACREGYTTGEIVKAITRLQGMGKTNKDIAAFLGISSSAFYLYVKLQKLPPELFPLMRLDRPAKERLKLRVAVAISQIENNPELQIALAEHICTQKMPVTTAMAHVKREAFAQGQSVGSMAGSPNKDYRRLYSLATRLPGKVEVFMGMPGSRFEDMLKRREVGELQTLQDRLKQAADELQGLQQMVQRRIDARTLESTSDDEHEAA